MDKKYISKQKFQRVAKLPSTKFKVAIRHKMYPKLKHSCYNGIQVGWEETTATSLILLSEGYFYYALNSDRGVRFVRSRSYPKYLLGSTIDLDLLMTEGFYSSDIETTYSSRVFGLRDIKDV